MRGLLICSKAAAAVSASRPLSAACLIELGDIFEHFSNITFGCKEILAARDPNTRKKIQSTKKGETLA